MTLMIKAAATSTKVFAGFMLSSLGISALGAESAAESQRIRRVETGLLPAGAMKENLGAKASIQRRMQAYGIPGLSIAVIDGGRIAWTKAYGEVEAGSRRPVTPATLFLAGSISKPVAALGALSLVQGRKLALDTDVNEALETWKIPSNDFTAKNPVTLRMLLSHSAGLTVHGFPGYEVGKPVPSLVQILNGEPPANTAAIRVDIAPGERMRYSGGGYTVMQQLLIDVSGQPFDTFMASAVLGPLDMRDSTYTQSLRPPLAERTAKGHYAGGEKVSGGHHIYPEMAAAGLWTTAADLAKYALHVQQAYAGKRQELIAQGLAKELLTKQKGEVGLGLFLSGEADTARFGHDGVDEGFDASLIAYVGRGQGAVVMANANFTHAFVSELMQSIAREYQWPGYPQTGQQEVVPMPRSIMTAAIGRYAYEDDILEVFARDNRLFGRMPGAGEVEIFATGEDRYFVPQFGSSFIRFEISDDRRVSGIRAGKDGRMRFERVE
jgi:CubicO group peptidase (beta-lactamase class C family)